MNEVKIGKIHYIRDKNNGFWINQNITNSHSATIITAELITLLRDYIKQGEILLSTISKKYPEEMLNDIRKKITNIENTVKQLESE